MIPLGAFVVAIVAIVAGVVAEANRVRLTGRAAHGDGGAWNEC